METAIEAFVDLSFLHLHFSCKPLVFGGLAMEHYGLRKHGGDIDLLVADEDYQALAAVYPEKRIDVWGNLGVILETYSFFRSVRHLDYHFYAAGAVEYEDFKVVSLDRLFFMAAAAMRGEPKNQKRKDDFELVFWSNYDKFKNPAYIQYMKQHEGSYKKAPNGTIYGGKYHARI